MTKSHQLELNNSEPSIIENASPHFSEKGLLEAREKTLQLFAQIKSRLTVGVNEPEARKIALSVAAEMGAKKHWHQPYIRFGSGTMLSFHEPLRPENTLKQDLPISIDLGPVWLDPETGVEYEGDFGDTFIFGESPDAQACIDWTHQIFHEAKAKWKTEHLTGAEIYQFIRTNCEAQGYLLGMDFDGHRISDFSHSVCTKMRLAKVPFVPSGSHWILEIQVRDPQGRFGAFYEDLL